MKNVILRTGCGVILFLLFATKLGAQLVLQNADFADGWDGWGAGWNEYDASGTWMTYINASDIAQLASMDGAGGARLTVAQDVSAAYTETFLVASHAGADFLNGDVIRFTGSYSAAVSKNGSGVLKARFIIRGLDTWYGVKEWSREYEVTLPASGDAAGTFDFSATVTDRSNLASVQIGVSIYADDARDAATLTVNNLKAWIDGDDSYVLGVNTPGHWAGFAITSSGYVDTGAWFGWIYPDGDWVWSCRFSRWVYLPQSMVRRRGAWVYLGSR